MWLPGFCCVVARGVLYGHVPNVVMWLLRYFTWLLECCLCTLHGFKQVARWLLGCLGWTAIGCCYVVARVFCVVIKIHVYAFGSRF